MAGLTICKHVAILGFHGPMEFPMVSALAFIIVLYEWSAMVNKYWLIASQIYVFLNTWFWRGITDKEDGMS